MPPTTPPNLAVTLHDDTVPLEARKKMLMHLCMSGDKTANEAVASLLKNARTPKTSKSVYDKRARELGQLIEEMQAGPLRHGTFVRMADGVGAHARAHVKLEDGASAFVIVPDANLAKTLRCGDSVLLEAQGKAVLFRDASLPLAGEEARFERRLEGDRIEVSLREHERFVYQLARSLAEKIEAGEVAPGRQLLVCSRRSMAFDAIPEADRLAHYRFLCREPVPDVVVERDIGCPPDYIEEVLERIRIAMLRPELQDRYRMPHSVAALLHGKTGTGKTLSINALWRRLYELMAEVTGVSIEELPPRVMRLRTSEILSKWFGEAERNLDRFFDEVEALAAEPFVGPDGREHVLPAFVVLEEIDGLGRARGEEPILSRIQTTALQRLDPARPELRGKLVLFVATTNVPEQMDTAFFRRIGGKVERFGRLNRSQFIAVLQKHLRNRPLAGAGAAGKDAARRLVSAATGWLFGGESDSAQVEIQYTGSAVADTKHRRDFLTGALVDRAVQDAAFAACRAEEAGHDDPGITLGLLLDGFDRQIRTIVDLLEPGNAADYMDVPDGARVASVRRLPRPSIQPHQLERAA